MQAPDQTIGSAGQYDISIVRPQLKDSDFKVRGVELTPADLKILRKALRTLHTLELMASTIYKFQLTKQRSELNRRLIAAMCNEMTHYQDFQVKLYEYGFRPAKLRWAFWIVGFILGFGSRLLGTNAILRTGVWVESRAVHHYAKLLETIAWDQDTRKIIEKDQADEHGHIAHWRALLK
jgi:ubiquinone biosynthesis monooxygenase Coq7